MMAAYQDAVIRCFGDNLASLIYNNLHQRIISVLHATIKLLNILIVPEVGNGEAALGRPSRTGCRFG
jgi:hypothetical protein